VQFVNSNATDKSTLTIHCNHVYTEWSKNGPLRLTVHIFKSPEIICRTFFGIFQRHFDMHASVDSIFVKFYKHKMAPRHLAKVDNPFFRDLTHALLGSVQLKMRAARCGGDYVEARHVLLHVIGAGQV